MKCPMPHKSQIITSAGRWLQCNAEADVIAAVPMINNRTGERSYAAQLLCIDHSVRPCRLRLHPPHHRKRRQLPMPSLPPRRRKGLLEKTRPLMTGPHASRVPICRSPHVSKGLTLN